MYVVVTAATAGEMEATRIHVQRMLASSSVHEIETAVTGIGLVSTAYQLTRILSRKPDLVIQAGIAGSFLPGKTGEVFSIAADRFGDLGVVEQGRFRSVFDLQLVNRDEAPFQNGVLPNPYTGLLRWVALPQVAAASVNEISTSPERISWFQQNTDCVVESMEGAAFHYVCLQEKVPFLQIRAVSNDIGERDRTKWKMKESIQALNEKLISLINKLTDPDETNLRF